MAVRSKALNPGMVADAAGTIASARPRGLKRLWRSRRGVAAVLAMMFLILFGSLSVAMAVVSKGNITTAATHQRVLRAHGAAETGLRVAQARLAEAASRFRVAESTINTSFGQNLWSGNLGSIGNYQVLPSKTGRLDLGTPSGLASAVAELHGQDADIVTDTSIAVTAVTIANAPAGVGSAYLASNWVYTPAVAVETAPVGSTIPPACFQVTYAPLSNGTDIRIVVTGYDFSYMRDGFNAAGTRTRIPVTRTIMQDFRLVKRVNHAIISPSRVMLGKNVLVDGDVGATFVGTQYNNGDPLIMRSDFLGLNATLDQKLGDFFLAVRNNDADGDNRLRVGHPIEGQAVPPSQTYLDGSGNPVNPFTDITGDGYLDDFDIFIKHYDANTDGRLALSWGPGTAEFTVDDDLALLIDSSSPDRNRNGISGFTDANGNRRLDSGETQADYDSVNSIGRDQILGWMDGYLDRRDRYAKVHGSLSFRVTETAWTTGQGDIANRVRGSVSPDQGDSPMRFNVDSTQLPSTDVSVFATTRSALQSAADGLTFNAQVATQLGIAENQLPTYVETEPAGSTQARFLRLDADANLDGRPDNWSSAYFEKMPYGAPNFTDYYYRPVYENFVFKDVQIPMGANALFKNCTFVGVTWVRSHTDNVHLLWGEYGKMRLESGTGRPISNVPRSIYGDSAGETSYPSMLPSSATPPNQMVLMANPPMDKADIPQNEVPITQGYNTLPDPLVIAGKRVTDTKAFSNNIRFHDCLFVGSIVSDAPTTYTQARNKMQFTGSTRFTSQHPTQPNNSGLNPETIDQGEIARSAMMLPNYSVDLGTFNSPPSQDLNLTGAIIAGVMDIRGNCDINGALLLTFNPELGSGPLRDATGAPVGNPAGFNATLGYFGPDDGDQESLDPNTLPLSGGQRLVGYDTNGDGLVDDGATSGTPVYFNGFGRINIRYNPDMQLPSGVMLPMQITPMQASYREGKL